MRYLRNFSDFVSCNQTEVQKMVHSICIRHNVSAWEDIAQEFYKNAICRKILHKYNPKHPSATKISTYLYKTILNIVRVYKNSNEYIIERRKVDLDSLNYRREDEDPYDVALTGNCWERDPEPLSDEYPLVSEALTVDYENRMHRNNFSDEIGGMNFDLQLFEKHLENKNRFYFLNKRKNKKIKTKGLTLLEIYRLMRNGYSNCEIARKYGVSNMFITTVKREIKNIMIKFGIVWNYRKIRDSKRFRKAD